MRQNDNFLPTLRWKCTDRAVIALVLLHSLVYSTLAIKGYIELVRTRSSLSVFLLCAVLHPAMSIFSSSSLLPLLP